LLKTKTIYRPIAVLIACSFIACTSVNNTPPKTTKPVIEPTTPYAAETTNPYAAVDKSPMDMSYYPVNYPMQLMTGNDSTGLVARVIYSRPQKNGRTIFGYSNSSQPVQQYGAYWRLGANEASEIEFFKPVTIHERKIPKGRYIIYCIPFEDKWTIVLNTNLYDWGLHPDASKDIARIDILSEKTARPVEFFTMVFQQSPTGANLVMAWDNVRAELPISF
jgi:hypothetical protein